MKPYYKTAHPESSEHHNNGSIYVQLHTKQFEKQTCAGKVKTTAFGTLQGQPS